MSLKLGSVIPRRVSTSGSYTDRCVDGRQIMTPSSVSHTAIPDRRITGQIGKVESVQPMSRTHELSVDGQALIKQNWEGRVELLQGMSLAHVKRG